MPITFFLTSQRKEEKKQPKTRPQRSYSDPTQSKVNRTEQTIRKKWTKGQAKGEKKANGVSTAERIFLRGQKYVQLVSIHISVRRV